MSRANCTIQNWIGDGRNFASVIGGSNSGLLIRGRRIALSPSRIAIQNEFKTALSGEVAGGWIQKWTDHTNLLKPVIDAGDSRHRQGPPSPQKGQQNLTKLDIKRRRNGASSH